jgi:hypothetical protein
MLPGGYQTADAPRPPVIRMAALYLTAASIPLLSRDRLRRISVLARGAAGDEPLAIVRAARSMSALLRFHLGAGVRVAVRACAVIFCAIVAWVLLQEQPPPAEFVVGLSKALFSRRLQFESIAPFVGLALLLPAWAAPRLSSGLNGWLRHLPFNGTDNRRGLAIGLVAGQLPLIVMLSSLALIAHGQGLPISLPAARWVLVLGAGATASLPVEHRFQVVVLGMAALVLAIVGSGTHMVVAAVLLIGTDFVAGRIRTRSTQTPRSAGSLMHWRIAWRALSFQIIRAYAVGVAALAAGSLLIVNNDLAGRRADDVARFAGSVAAVLFTASLSRTLALRRPSWALARSFPWSATRRVAEDGLFLAVHTLPLALLVAVQSGKEALRVLLLVPFLSLLAAGSMRRFPERRSESLVFLGEGLLAASLLTLLRWTAVGWLVAAIPVLYFSAEAERRQKVTRWSDLHHEDAGDPTVRSER